MPFHIIYEYLICKNIANDLISFHFIIGWQELIVIKEGLITP